MIRFFLAGAGIAALGASIPTAQAQVDDRALQDVIIVTGARRTQPTESLISPNDGLFQGGDATYLTARTPGGARIANGELSGQFAYRGLFGDRINLRVDGQRFGSGGPNLMDPVFHYAPEQLIASIAIDRGVSPVSEGPGLGGGADAVFKRIDYTGSADIDFGYDISGGARTVNDSFSLGGVVGAATDSWRFNVLGAYEHGNDTEFKDGVIAGTSFERNVYGLSAGAKTSAGEFTLDLRRQNTGPSGTPPFPMDILFFHTNFARLGYKNTFGGVEIEANVNYTDIEHGMNNFVLRPAPTPDRLRETFADATTWGGELTAKMNALGGTLKIGGDYEQNKHNALITNPANANFFVAAFPEIELQRYGAFAEWRRSAGPLMGEIGVRIDHHDHDAGDALVGPALPPPPNLLAANFNASDRNIENTTADAVIRLWTEETHGLSWRLTLARKEKAPGYIQRYEWLPIPASGGLADGNIYIGDVNLEPETAWIAEAGFDYHSQRAYFRPTVYIRRIDNYIQGVPFDATPGIVDSPVEMIAASNGDPTPLRWANVDAQLYGVDFDAGLQFWGPLRFDSVFSFVRGERRDIDDNLYRIAPPNLTAGLSWEQRNWSATFETRAVAKQNKVSVTNSELATDSYAVLNLRGEWRITDGVRLSGGVENLLNTVYRDHLSGYNRNGFGDVALFERIPGPGRGVFLRLSLNG